MENEYVKPEIIEEFRIKPGPFNYKKLVSLLEELNSNFAKSNKYSCAMNIRAILDHIPPLLGFGTFAEVTENYPWTRSDKPLIQELETFRPDADKVLHDPISTKEDKFAMADLPSKTRLGTLLNECLQSGNTIAPQSTAKTIKKPGILFELVDSEGVKWANFAVGQGVWSCFRLVINIDNYGSNQPDFISVKLTAKNSDGSPWEANNYCFQTPESNSIKVGNQLRIEAKDITSIGVFISQHTYGDVNRQPMPDIDMDTLQLEIKTRSDTHTIIPIKPGLIGRS